jgi:3beta-hydroxy-delta5-steroid dehydrogenase/steroid delta-isomerase
MDEEQTPSGTTELGNILVTGGAGFVGQHLAQTLLERGHFVRVVDLAPCSLSMPNLDKRQGNITDKEFVGSACEGIDTVFHTAAIIELGASSVVSKAVRDLSYAVNVEGTRNVIEACQAQGVGRLVYTSSNSVVLKGQPIAHGDETLPYVTKFRDLYTETKTQAEQLVLNASGQEGLLGCAIRPSGIWGVGDRTMFKRLFEELISGNVKVFIGDGSARQDNSYVQNLTHGHILAAQQLFDGGRSPGQAYFITDNEPMNIQEFFKPFMLELGYEFPTRRVPYGLLKAMLTVWLQLHHKLKIPAPPQPPTALERVGLTNYFSIEKARRDLGYEPLYNTVQAMEECLPYYKELHQECLRNRQ